MDCRGRPRKAAVADEDLLKWPLALNLERAGNAEWPIWPRTNANKSAKLFFFTQRNVAIYRARTAFAVTESCSLDPEGMFPSVGYHRRHAIHHSH